MSPKKLKDSQSPTDLADLIDEWDDLLAEFENESDRSIAMLAAAYLDTALRSLLEANMRDERKLHDRLFSPTGALGTFSSRISIAYGLGLITKSYYLSLHAIRDVRNAFAHFRRGMDFDDKQVSVRTR